MIDLSFLTDEEQEAILKVLQRDSDLKRVEEERVRHLPEKVKDESQVKNMSGQWFYEAKSKRHREKIHGADIIRASMRRKPLTTAELSHNKMGKKKNTWVNNVNKEVSIEDTETSPSFAALSADASALTAPQEGTKKAAASPSKERKNPFNSNLLEDDAQREDPGRRTSCSPASPKKDFILPSIENQSEVNLTNSRVEEPERTSAELNELQRQEGKPPVPKARKNMHKTSDVSLKSDDSFPQAPRRINPGNGKGTPPRGILKRNSSSSSTDSEMLRLIQTADPPNKNGLPTSAVLEGIAEKRSPPGRQPEEFSQNSLERSKQVRFSSNVSRKERPPSLELREGKESGEFVLLDSDYVKIHDDHASGLDSGQNDQVSPIKPFAFHSGELDGHAEDQTTSKEGTADPSSYNARGSGLPSDSLLSQKNLPSEPSSKMAPKLTKEPSVDEVKPETGTRQLNPEPDFPQSSTGQQFPSANTEDLQAPSISSTDLEQGKPVLVNGPSAKTPSKSEKHTAEALKAADESISKVLDWFKRSSSTDSEETLLSSSASQGRKPLEETSVTKTKELATTRDENGSSRDVPNQDPPLHVRKELTSKDSRLPDGGRPLELSSLAQTGYLSSPQREEQRLSSQSKARAVADVRDQRYMHFPVAGQGAHNADEMRFLEEANTESKMKGENSAWQDRNIFEGVKPSLCADSSGKKLEEEKKTQADGERNVKSSVKEGRFEHQTGVLLKEPEGQESSFLEEGVVQPDANDDGGKPLCTPQQETKQLSPTGDRKRIKDIRAFWEREQTSPRFGNKEELLNENASVKKVTHSYNKGSSKVKQTGESSGYVVGESVNEQGKYNLVTFRRVELSDDSEPNDDGIHLSSGRIRPEPTDNCKGGRVVTRSGKTLPSDWKSSEFAELPDADNLPPGHAVKFGGLPTGPLAKDRSSPAVQQKPNFTIHSLKEKVGEESKSEMLNPSQFRNLRSFWDVGCKPQSRADEAKDKRIPHGDSVRTYQQPSKEIKGVGSGQSFLKEDQKSQITQGVLNAAPKEPHPPSFATVGPRESLQFVPKEDSYSEETALSNPMEKTLCPGKEMEKYIEKTVAPSKMQPGLFNSSLQKLLTEASQDSSPVDLLADEGGAPKETEGKMHCSDHTAQRGAVSADIDSSVGPSTNEIAETIHRTLVPPKVGPGSSNAGLEKLLKEAASPTNCTVAVNTSKPSALLSEERGFYNKVMQLSRDAFPSGETKRDVAPQSLGESVSTSAQHASFQTSEENLPKEKEDLNPVPKRALSKGEDHMHLDDISSPEEALQIPSLKQILPDARLAVPNRAKWPGKEVSETVTESNGPLKRESCDLNSRLLSLLKESSELPSVSCPTESSSETALGGIPAEDQQRSYVRGMGKSSLPCPPMTSLPSQTRSGTIEKSVDKFSREGKPKGETSTGLPFVNQKSVRGQSDDKDNQDETSLGEFVEPQPKEVAKTIVKTVKSNSLEQTKFKDGLNKWPKEDSQVLLRDIEFPKPVHASLYSNQSVSLVDDKDKPPYQEVHEFVEKATAPSSSVDGDLKLNFQKLFMKDMASLPTNQKSTDGNVAERMTNKEREPNQIVDLLGQQDVGCQEIKETVNKTMVLPKPQQNELNSGLQKLLAEMSHLPPAQPQQLGGETKEETRASRQAEGAILLSQDTTGQSVAPEDDTVFGSPSGKLMKEHSAASSQRSKDSSKEVPDDSTAQSENGNLSVIMPALLRRASNEYRTEVKIPLKGKASRQDGQGLAGAKISAVPGNRLVFQKTVQVNPVSAEAPLAGKEAGSPTFARMGERESGHDKDTGQISSADVTLDSGSEEMDVLLGPRKASTPLAEQKIPPKVSQVELLLALHHGEDDEDEEDARSFGSDLSDESIDSFAGTKRNLTRSEEEPNPVVEALKRSVNRQIPSKSLEDIPSATSNKGKVNTQKEDLMLSAEDDQKANQPHDPHTTTTGISTAPSFPVNQFSNPEKVKGMSKSVPTFPQEESDDRETDTASDSSYPLGRMKKSPSSLTSLSGSSGLASLSSVSTSVVSVYSGDFGNVDVKGNIQFAIDYVYQLKELHVFIAQCKDLAVADVKKHRSDPYVKSYLLPEKYRLGKRKTSVKKKTLDPVYNEILRYKVDKALLTSQRLNISVWHHDTFGRNSFLGEVELDLGIWDWNDKQMIWYPLKPRAPLAALELENRGAMKLALQYVPQPVGGKKPPATGEVHIWVKECSNLPILRDNKINTFVKCTVLPDTSRKSRQRTRAVAKTTEPVFNHTMVYDGFKPEDLKEACIELTVWDHNKLVNHFLGGLRIGLGTGKSYGTVVDWMDSTLEETSLWERMTHSPNHWVEASLPLRMLTITK